MNAFRFIGFRLVLFLVLALDTGNFNNVENPKCRQAKPGVKVHFYLPTFAIRHHKNQVVGIETELLLHLLLLRLLTRGGRASSLRACMGALLLPQSF